MKRKTLLIVLFFMILFSRQALMSQTPQVDSLPIYNLFYLSKYITTSNLNPIQKEKVYGTLVALIRSSGHTGRIGNHNINAFIDKQEDLLKSNIKTMIESQLNYNSLDQILISVTNSRDSLINNKIKEYYSNRDEIEKQKLIINDERETIEEFNNLFKSFPREIIDIESDLDNLLSKYNTFNTLQKEFVSIENSGFETKVSSLKNELSYIMKIKELLGSVTDDLQNYSEDSLKDKNFVEFIGFVQNFKNLLSKESVKFKDFNDSLHKLSETYQKINDSYKKELSKFKIEEELNNFIKNNKTEELRKKSILFLSTFKLDILVDFYKKDEFDTLEKKFETLRGFLDSVVSSVFDNYKHDIESLNKLKQISFQYSSPTVQQIQINSIVHAAEQNAVSSFKLPSESDLINAVAMFLAKRAKQEAMIWFIDRLKEDMHNPLIFDAFPNTFNLLRESESFNQPSFGQKWRYALSQDLIKMPLALLESPWINKIWATDAIQEKQIKEAVEMINISKEIFELLQSQYNYRDIVRYIHMNKSKISHIDKEGKLNENEILDRFDFLYMVINEFYSVDIINNIPTYRILTFEELSNLNSDQWSVFVELVRIKYKEKVSKSLCNYLNKRESENISAYSFNKLGSLLLTLSQFDKIRNSTNEHSENNTATNLWGNLLRVVEQLDTSDKDKKVIEYFKSGVKIYDYIYQNKFDLVVQETIDLLTKCLINNELDSIELNFTISRNKIITDPNNKNELLHIFHRLFENFKFNKGFVDDIRISFNFNSRNLCINDKNVELMTLSESLNYLNYIKTDFNKDKDLWDIIRQKILSDPSVNNLILAALKDDYSSGKKEIPFQVFQNIKVIVDLINYKKSSEPIPIQNIANTIESLTHENELYNKYAKQLVRTTSFFSEMFYASDAKAMAAVIDRHALPPTSYTLKRKVPFSVTFNGYVGVYGGIKRFYSENEFITNYKDVKTNYGLTAPVGFTFSKSSGGVFVQLIDVGNLVGHYLWNVNPNETRPKVTFKEVISPGINFMHYLTRSPFVIFGGIRGILLDEKNITEKNGDGEVISLKKYNTSVLDMVEFNVGIKIDIPIFNIYSKRY